MAACVFRQNDAAPLILLFLSTLLHQLLGGGKPRRHPVSGAVHICGGKKDSAKRVCGVCARVCAHVQALCGPGILDARIQHAAAAGECPKQQTHTAMRPIERPLPPPPPKNSYPQRLPCMRSTLQALRLGSTKHMRMTVHYGSSR